MRRIFCVSNVGLLLMFMACNTGRAQEPSNDQRMMMKKKTLLLTPERQVVKEYPYHHNNLDISFFNSRRGHQKKAKDNTDTNDEEQKTDVSTTSEALAVTNGDNSSPETTGNDEEEPQQKKTEVEPERLTPDPQVRDEHYLRQEKAMDKEKMVNQQHQTKRPYKQKELATLTTEPQVIEHEHFNHQQQLNERAFAAAAAAAHPETHQQTAGNKEKEVSQSQQHQEHKKDDRHWPGFSSESAKADEQDAATASTQVRSSAMDDDTSDTNQAKPDVSKSKSLLVVSSGEEDASYASKLASRLLVNRNIKKEEKATTLKLTREPQLLEHAFGRNHKPHDDDRMPSDKCEVIYAACIKIDRAGCHSASDNSEQQWVNDLSRGRLAVFHPDVTLSGSTGAAGKTAAQAAAAASPSELCMGLDVSESCDLNGVRASIRVTATSVTWDLTPGWGGLEFGVYVGNCPHNDGGAQYRRRTKFAASKQKMNQFVGGRTEANRGSVVPCRPDEMETHSMNFTSYPLLSSSAHLPFRPMVTHFQFTESNYRYFLNAQDWPGYNVFPIRDTGNTQRHLVAVARVCPCSVLPEGCVKKTTLPVSIKQPTSSAAASRRTI